MAGLGEIAAVIGTLATREGVAEAIRKSVCYVPEIMPYILRYIDESPDEQAGKLMVFITGSTSTDVNITIEPGIAGNLPVAHTCSNKLDIARYSDYESFKAAMDIALSQFDSFGNT
jgi:hypothetical protein